jgi:hypothetical protein
MNDFERQTAAEEALSGVRAKGSAPPARDEMLAQVYLRANTKEKHMTVFDKLFSGRPLAAKLGIAGALLVLLVAAAVLLPPRSNSLAATEGVVLNYDLSAFGKEQAKSKFKEVEDAINSHLPDGVELLTANLRGEVRREQRVVKHNGVEQGSPQETETTKISGVVVLSSADEAVVTKLCDDVALAVPGVGKPAVQDATWFREQGAGIEGGTFIGLNLKGRDHSFNFPDGTSAEQMESEIRAWLAEAHPGEEFNVDVELEESGSGSEQRREVKVKIEGGDDEEK